MIAWLICSSRKKNHPTGLIQVNPSVGAARDAPHVALPSEGIDPDTADNDADEDDDDEEPSAYIDEINQGVNEDDDNTGLIYNPDVESGHAPPVHEPVVDPPRPVSRRRGSREVEPSGPASSSRCKVPRVSTRASGSVRVGVDRSANGGSSSFWNVSTVWVRNVPFVERTDQKHVLDSVFIHALGRCSF